jgi:hypothetical protein
MELHPTSHVLPAVAVIITIVVPVTIAIVRAVTIAIVIVLAVYGISVLS